MFLDASAIVAILLDEDGARELEARIETTPGPLFISPLVRFESALAIARAKTAGENASPGAERIAAAKAAVDSLTEVLGAEEIAISSEIGDLALEVVMTYGRAAGHPAALNFGDCYAYACAKWRGVGLLYKGNDFAKTDLA